MAQLEAEVVNYHYDAWRLLLFSLLCPCYDCAALWHPPVEMFSWRRWLLFSFSAGFISFALIIGGAAVALCGSGAKIWVEDSSLSVVNNSYYDMTNFIIGTLKQIEFLTLHRVARFVVILL